MCYMPHGSTSRAGRGAARKLTRIEEEAYLLALQRLDKRAEESGSADAESYFHGPTEVMRELLDMGFAAKRPAVSARLKALQQAGKLDGKTTTNTSVAPGGIGFVYSLKSGERNTERTAQLASALEEAQRRAAAHTPRARRRAAPGHSITTLELDDDVVRMLYSLATERGVDRSELANQFIRAGIEQHGSGRLHKQVLRRYPSTSRPLATASA